MGQGDQRWGSVRLLHVVAATASAVALAQCSSSDQVSRKVDPKYGVAASPRVVNYGEAVPKGGGVYRVGRPYIVAGRTYVPEDNQDYAMEGLASWYGDDFHGRRTANGEIFDMDALSGAHPTLPMPSYVRVTNLQNRRSVIVRINDRGPYHQDRVIDVSRGAARVLGFHGGGVARVKVEYVGPAPLEGSDDHMLMSTLRHREPAPVPSAVMLASTSSRTYAPPVPPADIPLPSERPFSLGEPEAAVAARRGSPTFAQRWPRAPAARDAIALAPRSPDRPADGLDAATAYAPPVPDLSAGPAMRSVRGLY